MNIIRKIQNALKTFASKNSKPSGYVNGVYSGTEIPYIPFHSHSDGYDIYPFNCLDKYRASSTLRQGINLDSKITRGGGFFNETFAKMKINSLGDTVASLLRKTSLDLSIHNGFAWHVTYNGLMQISEIRQIPFPKIRLALPNNDGSITKVGITTKYDYLLSNVYPSNYYVTSFYDKFNNSKDFLEDIIEKENGIGNYNGQIFIVMNKDSDMDFYPYAKYNSVFKDADCERSIAESLLYDIEDRFKADVIVTEYGVDKLTAEEKEEAKKEYQEYSGTDGARIMLRFAKTKESEPSITQIERKDLSNNYKWADESRSEKIRRSFMFPDLIYGIATAGKLGQSNEVESVNRFANALVMEERILLEDAFRTVFSGFTNIALHNDTMDFKIKNWNILNERL